MNRPRSQIGIGAELGSALGQAQKRVLQQVVGDVGPPGEPQKKRAHPGAVGAVGEVEAARVPPPQKRNCALVGAACHAHV